MLTIIRLRRGDVTATTKDACRLNSGVEEQCNCSAVKTEDYSNGNVRRAL